MAAVNNFQTVSRAYSIRQHLFLLSWLRSFYRIEQIRKTRPNTVLNKN